MQSETAYTDVTTGNPNILPRQEYREKVQAEMRRLDTLENPAVYLIDTVNKLEEIIVATTGPVKDTDIMIEEIVAWLDKRYPSRLPVHYHKVRMHKG